MSHQEADSFFEKLASGSSVDTREVFKFEFNRLHSFVSWPKEAKAYPTCLARAGLYYLGTSDTVACFVCNVHLGQWEEEDLPLGEHERHSPNCGFVRGQDVGNVPLMTNGQNFTVEAIREQEDEIRNQRATAQSAGLGQSSDDGTSNNVMELLQKQLKELTIKYPFSVVNHQPSRGSHFIGKIPMVLGSRYHDSMLEGLSIHGGSTRGGSSMQAEVGSQVQQLTSTGSDATSTGTSNLSVRQQQINQAIISISTEPVRQGVTEYCPLDMLKSIMQSANHPQYAHINRRMESYATWPYSHVQSPIKLAEAGFYYTGREDRIRCFLCNGGLCNWEAEDIPWYEHCRWFERCRYAVACKRNEVVAAIVNTASQLRSTSTHTTLEGQTQCDDTQRASTHTSPEGSLTATTQRGTSNTSGEASAQSLRRQLLDMGFGEDRVNTVLETRGTNISVEQAVGFLTELPPSPPNAVSIDAPSSQQDVTSAGASTPVEPSGVAGAAGPDLDQEAEAKGSGPETKEETGKKKKKKNRKKKGKKDGSPTREEEGVSAAEPLVLDEQLSLKTDLEEQAAVTSLKQENEALKSRRICKVCMEKEVCIVFLPCSHLVCCLECAMQLNSCPMCRGPIKATVKVYI